MEYKIKADYQEAVAAEGYDTQFTSSPRARLTAWGEKRAFLSMLARVPTRRPASELTVLDIACGTGRFLDELLNRGYKATGTDVSPQMLAVARRRVGSKQNLVSLQIGDAEQLPFGDQQFDGVSCIRLYQRVPSPARVQMLKEVKRVGRGWAILFFAMSTPSLDLRRRIRSMVLSRHPTISHPITFRQLREELDQAGLTVAAREWTLPGLSDGLVILVTW